MYGYDSDDGPWTPERSSVWDSQESLQGWANEEEPVQVDVMCASPKELVQSQSFETFLRIFNNICARDAAGRQMYGYTPVTSDKILQEKWQRDRAYELWTHLRLQGRVHDICNLNSRLQEWMKKLDALEVKEHEAADERLRIVA